MLRHLRPARPVHRPQNSLERPARRQRQRYGQPMGNVAESHRQHRCRHQHAHQRKHRHIGPQRVPVDAVEVPHRRQRNRNLHQPGEHEQLDQRYRRQGRLRHHPARRAVSHQLSQARRNRPHIQPELRLPGTQPRIASHVVQFRQRLPQRPRRAPQQRRRQPRNRQHGHKRKLEAGIEQLFGIHHQQRQPGQRNRVQRRAFAVQQRRNLIGKNHQHRAQYRRAQVGHPRIACGQQQRRQHRVLLPQPQPSHQPQQKDRKHRDVHPAHHQQMKRPAALELQPLVVRHQSALAQHHRLEQPRIRLRPQPGNPVQHAPSRAPPDALFAASAQPRQHLDAGRFRRPQHGNPLPAQPAHIVHVARVPVIHRRPQLGPQPQPLPIVEHRRSHAILRSVLFALPPMVGARHIQIEPHTPRHRLRYLAIELRLLHRQVERLMRIASRTQRTRARHISGQRHLVAAGVLQQRRRRHRPCLVRRRQQRPRRQKRQHRPAVRQPCAAHAREIAQRRRAAQHQPHRAQQIQRRRFIAVSLE